MGVQSPFIAYINHSHVLDPKERAQREAESRKVLEDFGEHVLTAKVLNAAPPIFHGFFLEVEPDCRVMLDAAIAARLEVARSNRPNDGRHLVGHGTIVVANAAEITPKNEIDTKAIQKADAALIKQCAPILVLTSNFYERDRATGKRVLVTEDIIADAISAWGHIETAIICGLLERHRTIAAYVENASAEARRREARDRRAKHGAKNLRN